MSTKVLKVMYLRSRYLDCENKCVMKDLTYKYFYSENRDFYIIFDKK